MHPSTQCDIPPPGMLLLLCISSSSGSDSTKHAPNSRNNCSNDNIIACFVTWRFRMASALPSTRPGGVPCAISVAVMPASRSRVASLNWVTCVASWTRLIVAKRCSSVAEMAIPTLPPSWRIRLNSPVPFGILLIGRSASARFVSGTKISPSPTPRKISGQKKSVMPLAVVKCACFHIDRAKIDTPARMLGRDLMPDEREQRDRADHPVRHHFAGLEPVEPLAPLEHRLQRADPRGEQHQPDVVHPLGLLLEARVLDEREGQGQRQHADRDVDVEDPGPPEGIGDVPAQRRPERRSHHHADAEDRHRGAVFLARELLVEDGL